MDSFWRTLLLQYYGNTTPHTQKNVWFLAARGFFTLGLHSLPFRRMHGSDAVLEGHRPWAYFPRVYHSVFGHPVFVSILVEDVVNTFGLFVWHWFDYLLYRLLPLGRLAFVLACHLGCWITTLQYFLVTLQHFLFVHAVGSLVCYLVLLADYLTGIFGMICMVEVMSVIVACFWVSCFAIIHSAKQPSIKLLQSHAVKRLSCTCHKAVLLSKQFSS